jgi:LysM repeat protein
MSARRMLPFILINIVISVVVVLAILYFWDSRRGGTVPIAAVTAVPQAPPPITPELAINPQGTNTPEAGEEAEGPPIHIVKSGDTLNTIAQIYDVSLEDIVEANGIVNPNVLSVGQQLVIPVGGLATATPPPPPEATASILPSPIPTEPVTVTQGTADVVEITAVISPGELETEAVQIVNAGSAPIALQDWKLVDLQGHIYTFAQVTLFGDGAGILVHTGPGRDGATDIYWGLAEGVWEPGELVTLLDSEENIIATFNVPAQE